MSPLLKDVVVLLVSVYNLLTLNIFSELIIYSGVKILITSKLEIKSTYSTKKRAF